jgi:hypothetical protein
MRLRRGQLSHPAVALVAGARLALDAMRASPEAPATAIELLGRVLDDFDRARERLSESPASGDRH